jgi:hypothetical protein
MPTSGTASIANEYSGSRALLGRTGVHPTAYAGTPSRRPFALDVPLDGAAPAARHGPDVQRVHPARDVRVVPPVVDGDAMAAAEGPSRFLVMQDGPLPAAGPVHEDQVEGVGAQAL